MIRNKYALQRLRRNKLKKKKKQFEITVIHVFTACILAIALFAFTSEAKTIDKPPITDEEAWRFFYE